MSDLSGLRGVHREPARLLLLIDLRVLREEAVLQDETSKMPKMPKYSLVKNVTLYAANIVILKIIWPLENIKYLQMTTLFLSKKKRMNVNVEMYINIVKA